MHQLFNFETLTYDNFFWRQKVDYNFLYFNLIIKQRIY